MDKRALQHARRAIEKANRALQRLKNYDDLLDAEDAWEDFLFASSKVYEKLRGGARGYPVSWAWFLKRSDERRDDPLLSYIHHARNADHHRLEETTERELGFVGVKAKNPTGALLVKNLTIEKGVIKVLDAENAHVDFIPAHLKLGPVIDRGKEYPVPSSHRGTPIKKQDPATVGSLTLDYLQDMLADAQSLCP